MKKISFGGKRTSGKMHVSYKRQIAIPINLSLVKLTSKIQSLFLPSLRALCHLYYILYSILYEKIFCIDIRQSNTKGHPYTKGLTEMGKHV